MADRSRFPEMPGESAAEGSLSEDEAIRYGSQYVKALELREALAIAAARYMPGPARHTAATELADDLLAGPLAPLLAKVQAVEALHVSGEHGMCAGCGWTFPCPTFRALGGESRG